MFLNHEIYESDLVINRGFSQATSAFTGTKTISLVRFNSANEIIMTTSPESQFLQALEMCQSLSNLTAQFSSIPCRIIEILSDVSQEPRVLYSLLIKYSREVDSALVALDIYAKNADNWRVKD
jgi:hypothetical protein